MPATCPIGTDVALAGRLLRDGGVVAFGTETVYGLGADARNVDAVARVFSVKNRPTFDPLIVHLADLDQVQDVADQWTTPARRLAERFWPGPLTLVVPKRAEIPDLVTAGRPTVAVRVPGAERARALLESANCPVAAPSANPFGRISPTTAAHVAEQLGEQIDYILDCGRCEVGIESTVVDVTESPPGLLRPGGISLEELQEVLGTIHNADPTDERAPRAPGRLSKHYAPQTPLRIVEQPRATHPRTGLLTLGPLRDRSQFEKIEVLSPNGDLTEAAASFFAALRRLDAAGLEEILATPFPEVGLGRALNDRLRRAAHRS